MSRTRDGGRREGSPPPLPTWLVVLFLVQLLCNVVMWGAGSFVIYRLNEYWMIDSRNMWRVIDQLEAPHATTEGEGDDETAPPDE